MIRFHIITLFPEAFESYLGASIISRAQEEKKIAVRFWNQRDEVWIKGVDKRRQTDGRPYGGGPGMVMMAEPILKAAEKIRKQAERRKGKLKVIFFSPGGRQFDTAYAKGLVSKKKYTDIVLLCGHYEGIDARVPKILKAEEISIGPYVLTGGELPAMLVIDCVSRQIPGVLGKYESLEETRVSSSEVYTRPEVLAWKGKKYRVPKVLLSGHHKKIEEWKRRDVLPVKERHQRP
jgi:tRNA (guanine37-N1)-methyltransferase